MTLSAHPTMKSQKRGSLKRKREPGQKCLSMENEKNRRDRMTCDNFFVKQPKKGGGRSWWAPRALGKKKT